MEEEGLLCPKIYLHLSINSLTMKNLHIKDDFSTNQVNPHTHIEFWKQDKVFFCKVFLFLFLMIALSGGLNAQTAESACDCHEFFDRGVTGETWNISELDPIVNCTRFKGTIVIDVRSGITFL
jgi:hypothetical protein